MENCFKTMDNHAYELTKQEISGYTCIRMKHHAKLLNENPKKKQTTFKAVETYFTK